MELNYDKGKWAFDEKVSSVFDTHVRQSVPCYDLFHQQIAEISKIFIHENSVVYDIGSSTGETLKNLSNLHIDKKQLFVGIDNSKPMCDIARDRFRQDKRIVISHADATDNKSILQESSFITCILSLQFIPLNKRASLIKKLYDNLEHGGALVIVEKNLQENNYFTSLYRDLYHDFKRDNGLSEEHIKAKEESLKGVMTPIRVTDTMYLLRHAGFEQVHTFFQYYNFNGIMAVKNK